jgi:hypothetical protein
MSLVQMDESRLWKRMVRAFWICTRDILLGINILLGVITQSFGVPFLLGGM